MDVVSRSKYPEHRGSDRPLNRGQEPRHPAYALFTLDFHKRLRRDLERNSLSFLFLMCCHIECAEFQVGAALSGANAIREPATAKADEADDAPPFFVLPLLFFSPLTRAEGLF